MHNHLGDRLSNAISHGLGLILSIIGVIALLTQATTKSELIARSVYGISLISLYLFSTIHHAIKMKDKRGFYLLQSLDQIAIYLLIAGTYTPFILLGTQSSSSWFLLRALWSIAIFGSVLKIAWPRKAAFIHVVFYVLMGWSMLLLWPEFNATLSKTIIQLILLGGVFYTGGIPFYLLSHLKTEWHYTHLIWHLFVVAGSVVHFLAIYQL